MIHVTVWIAYAIMAEQCNEFEIGQDQQVGTKVTDAARKHLQLCLRVAIETILQKFTRLTVRLLLSNS